MNLLFSLSDTTGRFMVREAGGRVLFETHRLNGEDRANLKVAFEHVAQESFKEGRSQGRVDEWFKE